MHYSRRDNPSTVRLTQRGGDGVVDSADGPVVGNWPCQLTQATVAPLVQINQDLVTGAVQRLALLRLTMTSTARWCAPGPPWAGRFAASIRITGRIPATTRCWPTWPGPGTSALS
jgi:hypothetical protein